MPETTSNMFPRVVNVRHVQDYCLELTFSNDEQGVIDFRQRVVGRGGVFTPLEEVSFFKQVKVDPEIGTIVWPNEVDFDPDVLYSEARGYKHE